LAHLPCLSLTPAARIAIAASLAFLGAVGPQEIDRAAPPPSNSAAGVPAVSISAPGTVFLGEAFTFAEQPVAPPPVVVEVLR